MNQSFSVGSLNLYGPGKVSKDLEGLVEKESEADYILLQRDMNSQAN